MPENRAKKKEMDSYRLHALAFYNPDFVLRQPIKLVDQDVYLPVGYSYSLVPY